MTNRQERIILSLMSINALAFVVIFLFLAFNYRLAADDYHHAQMVSQHGIWDAMVYYYNNWNPRWSSILVTNTFLSSASKTWTLFLFHCCSLLLGFVAVWSLLKGLISKFQLPFTSLQAAILSIYLIMATFHTSFSKADTWFWITVNPMYLWGTFAAILGGSFLFQNWLPIARYVLVGLMFLYAGGSSESVALCSLVVLFFVGFISKNSNNQNIDRTALHFATVACMVGFAIAMTGNGIQVRREHLPHHPASDRLILGLWNYVKFNFYRIPTILPIAILAVAPFGFFGRKHLRFQLISWKDVFWSNRKLWLIADLMVGVLAMALGWVMCEMGPERTWFPITVLVVTVSVALAYQLGSWAYIILKGRLFQVVVLAQLLLLSFQVTLGFIRVPESFHYANAHDARTVAIQAISDSEDNHKVASLPDSGWLMSGDISQDPDHFTNMHLGLYFGLSQPIVADSSLISGR